MSAVWTLFRKFVDDTGSDVAECRICSKIYKIPRCRSTSNLLRHLKENHPEELRNANATRTRREKNNNDPKQPTLEETLKGEMTKAQKENLDKKLATTVAYGSLPLSFVASSSFNDFVTALNPSYRTPSTKGLKDVMRAQVQEVDDEHRALFVTAADVAITIDCWKSKNGNCSLLSVTGHAFSSDFNRRHNVVLDCITLKEKSQTANIIASKIRQSFSRLSISETRLKYVVADGAMVMENVSRDFGAKYIHCCAHVINLIVSKSISTTPASGLIRRIKHVVAKINKSSKTKFEYREYLQEMDLPKKMPCTECSTRWGSTFLMLSDVLNAMPAFDRLMDYLKLQRFEIEEARVLKKIRNFLEPYHTMTNQVCFKDSTASMYIGVAQILISATEMSLSSSSMEAREFADALLKYTKLYFKDWMQYDSLQLSSFLDPRTAFLETVFSKEKWASISEEFVDCRSSELSSRSNEENATTKSSRHGDEPVWSILTQPRNDCTPISSSRRDELVVSIDQIGQW